MRKKFFYDRSHNLFRYLQKDCLAKPYWIYLVDAYWVRVIDRTKEIKGIKKIIVATSKHKSDDQIEAFVQKERRRYF